MTSVSKPFWDAVAQEGLELQHCAECGRWVHYPRVVCPYCWEGPLEWRPVSGIGVVKTFTVIERPGHPAWRAETPYVVALVELIEGATMLSNVVGVNPALVEVGMRVRVTFAIDGAQTLPQFVPVASEGQ